VGLRYEFASIERPTLWLSFGDALEDERDPARGLAAQEAAVERELDRIERAVRGEDEGGFVRLHRAPTSRIGEVLTAMLAWMTRPWVMRALPPRRASADERG
jgi:hypothetical protein